MDSSKKYKEIFLNSDVVISPVRSGEIDIKNEIRGTTHGTGFIFDCIEYARPFIVPNGFKVAGELKTSSITYENATHLENQISELLESKEKLKNIQKKAMINSEKFSLDRQREYFKKVLDQLT